MKKFLTLLLVGSITASVFAQDVLFTWTLNPSAEMVSGYRIEYKKFPVTTNWTYITFAANTNSVVVKGLQAGYVYQFRAFAVNGIGLGTNQSTIVQIPTTTPSAVQDFNQN